MKTRRLIVSQAAIDAIYSDPPLDPVGCFAHVRGIPRTLAEVLLHLRLHEPPASKRFAPVIAAGWIPWVRNVEDAADIAAIDAYFASRADWKNITGNWYNHVAKARIIDTELIVLVNFRDAMPELYAYYHPA